MAPITNARNLSMDVAGLIGRASGTGKSTILDAAAIRTLTDTLTSTEVGIAISAGLATIDLSGKVSKSGDTMTGALSLGSNALTCGAITASGNLTLQNATTAVLAEISKTYTSSTDREYLSLGYNSGLTGYFVGSRVGSAGGSARDLKIGHLAADGTTFAGLTVATSGNSTFAGIVETATTGSYGFTGRTKITSPADGQITFINSATTRSCRFSFVNSNILDITDTAGSVYTAVRCGAITASGNLTLQNSTTAVLAEISKTYTSSTDREYLSLGYNSGLTGYFLGSRVGSAGGTARDLKIGHLAANGTTFAGLTVATSGALSCGAITASGRVDLGNSVLGAEKINIYGTTTSPSVVIQSASTTSATGIAFAAASLSSSFRLLSASPNTAGALTIYMQQNGTGDIIYDTLINNTGDALTRYSINGGEVWATGLDNSDSDAFVISNGSGLGIRNALRIGTDLSAVFSGSVTASAGIISTPSASVTLSTNLQATLEFTSNTNGNIVFRGSDGTTRRFNFTVS